MRIPIETNQKFVFRLEDFIYIFCILYIYPIAFAVYNISLHSRFKNSAVIIIAGLILTCLMIQSLMIYLSYRKRLQDDYYVEHETIIRERNGQEIFRIPFKEIVSVRVYNKRGAQGSIVFFTHQASKKYSANFYFPMHSMVPFSVLGFTKNKINLVKNRKQLITAIYLVNPNLHFIE